MARAKPLSLGSLGALPLEERADLVERHGGDELGRTCDALARAQSRSAGTVTPKRLAWAMAYNIAGQDGAASAPDGLNARLLGVGNRLGANCWSAETPWSIAWTYYVRPHHVIVFPTDEIYPADRTLLRDLARSVACEQRAGYPWSPEAVDATIAQACQHEVYELSRTRIAGLLAKHRRWGAARDEIISDTWVRAMRSAWSHEATHRFVGRSLISSWLCSIAINTAKNHERASARLKRREEPWAPADMEQLSGAGADLPGEAVNDVDLARRFRACLESLDDVSRELLRQFVAGRTPGDIARARGTTAPTISQHQERLIRDIRRCFGERTVRQGTTQQKVFKAVRHLLASVGPELFPFLRKTSQRTDEP